MRVAVCYLRETALAAIFLGDNTRLLFSGGEMGCPSTGPRSLRCKKGGCRVFGRLVTSQLEGTRHLLFRPLDRPDFR